jgi:hypothetical protein
VLVVSVGRLGDMYGRVKMYNLGFVIYTVASLFLTIDWMTGHEGALWLLVWRIVQGVGGAFLVGNSGAILTDAFPVHQRGLALGINNVAGISGTFIGLVIGGILAPINWRLVFLISVPTGTFGTVWAYRRLHDLSERTKQPIDWAGNLTFAVGLVLVMVGVTYGIQPYGGHPLGWSSPTVITCQIALAGSREVPFVGRHVEDIQHPVAAVDHQVLPGDPARLVAGQERDGVGHVPPVTLDAQRGQHRRAALPVLLHARPRRLAVMNHLGDGVPHVADADAVHADPPRCVLGRQRRRQDQRYPALADRVPARDRVDGAESDPYLRTVASRWPAIISAEAM